MGPVISGPRMLFSYGSGRTGQERKGGIHSVRREPVEGTIFTEGTCQLATGQTRRMT